MRTPNEESSGNVRKQVIDNTRDGLADGFKDLEDVVIFGRDCFAKRYAESRLEIHIHVVMNDSNNFCATLQRSPVDSDRNR